MFSQLGNESFASGCEISVAWTAGITDEYRHVFLLVNVVLLCSIVSMFGIIGNIINLFVFYRQGLNTTTNISFFVMAFSDLSCLLLQEWYIVLSFFHSSELPFVYQDFQYITSGVPHEGFSRLTCSITVYITAERCLCIVIPLKIKRLITFKRTRCIIICFTISTLLSAIPLYCTVYIDWKFYPEKNRTLLGLVITGNKDTVEVSLFTVNAIFGAVSITAVIIFTSISIYKLKEKAAWRKSANVQQEKSESLSRRDRTTMVMVVLIAIILVVCYTPSVVLCLVTCFVPEFNIDGRYVNLYYMLWSLALLLENTNASVNIILYLKMSTNYRVTFKSLFLKS